MREQVVLLQMGSMEVNNDKKTKKRVYSESRKKFLGDQVVPWVFLHDFKFGNLLCMPFLTLYFIVFILHI